MANTPDQTENLAFIIKKYPDGKFSGELDSGGIRVGAEVSVVGPYGTCFRREGREGPIVLVGAGSGMSPIWSILHDHVASGEDRPVYFFYGARTRDDLFHLDRIDALAAAIPGRPLHPRAQPRRTATRTGRARGASSTRRSTRHAQASSASTARATSTPAGRRR